MNATARPLFVAMTLALPLVGCSSAPSARSSSPYETLAPDPTRDTPLAQREHARAIEMIDAGKWKEAEATLKRALAADVMLGPAHNTLGSVYYRAGNYYLAAWEFQYASKLMPGQPEPRNNLGLVFEATGKLDEAVAAYDVAIGFAPDDPQFIGNAARARVRRGDPEADVRPLLQRLLVIDDRDAWVDWSRRLLANYPRDGMSAPGVR